MDLNNFIESEIVDCNVTHIDFNITTLFSLNNFCTYIYSYF